MSWVRFEDTYPDHPKVLGLSADAFRLHVTAICYCERHLTDGLLPAVFWKDVALRDELVRARLIDKTRRGWKVHDYHHYQMSKAEVLSRREAKHEARSRAGRLGAASRWGHGKRGSKRIARAIAKNGSPPLPSPLSLSLIPTEELSPRTLLGGSAARERKGFTPPTIEEIKNHAAHLGYTGFDAEYFFAHHATRGWKLKGGQLMKDWKQAVVTWRRNEGTFGRGDTLTPKVSPPAPAPNPLGIRASKDGAGVNYAGEWYRRHPDGKRWLTEEGYRPDGTSTMADPKDAALNEKVWTAMNAIAGKGEP